MKKAKKSATDAQKEMVPEAKTLQCEYDFILNPWCAQKGCDI